VASYRRNLRVHVVPRLGGIRLQALTPMHLDKMYAELLARGNMRTEGTALSARTVRYVHTVLKKALSDATRKGLLMRNPSDAATPPTAKSAKAREMAFWSPAELHRFLAAVESDDLFPMLRLVAMSGLRRGEACGLRWSDVDLDTGRVQVRQTLVPIASGTGRNELLMQETTKSDAGRRHVDLDPATVAVLRTHRARQAQLRLSMGTGWTDSGLVFTEITGGHVNPTKVSARFDVLVRRFDGPRLRFHDLRHTHCAHLIDADVNIKTISRRLGHASVSFTLDRYGHLMPEADGEAAVAVAALVDGVAG
jgi:integrase